MTKVSVIMPVYNGEKYITSAINSLIAQPFSDWELWVIDDGSTDSTPEILNRFTDERIRRIRQENKGEAMARNAGLDCASGEYIAFLDADDEYLPNALQDLSDFLDRHPEFDVVYSDGFICSEKGKRLVRLTEIRPGIYTGEILERVMLDPGIVAVVNCTLTRRQSITSIGARFDSEMVIGPDWDFWIQMATQARFGYLDRTTCLYRVHSTNIQKTSGIQKRRNNLVYGRLKIMHANWFKDLSEPSREKFFHFFLVNQLDGQTDQQLSILESTQVNELSPLISSRLWRQVGISALFHSRSNFAEYCLDQGLEIRPADAKIRILRTSLKVNRDLTLFLIRSWRRTRKFIEHITAGVRPKPKPIPDILKSVEYY